LSGLRSLEAQDVEIGSGILLGEGLASNGEPLVDEDGSLMILNQERAASQVRDKTHSSPGTSYGRNTKTVNTMYSSYNCHTTYPSLTAGLQVTFWDRGNADTIQSWSISANGKVIFSPHQSKK
jgi:hypothetical protein